MLATAIVCATVLYLAHRGEALLREYWAQRTPPTTEGFTPEPMPDLVRMIAQRESEPWAQAQAIESMKGLYNELRDWNKVAETYLNTGTT